MFNHDLQLLPGLRVKWVEAGDVIGFVGTTGNARPDAPHLHYGVYTRDGAVNPYPLLTAPDTLAPDTLVPDSVLPSTPGRVD